MRDRNAKVLQVYSARITTSKQLCFANLLRISIENILQIYKMFSLIVSKTKIIEILSP